MATHGHRDKLVFLDINFIIHESDFFLKFLDSHVTLKPLTESCLMFDSSVLMHMSCLYLNRYAEQQRAANPPMQKWTPVDIPSMKTFIGLCMSMGVLRLPARHDYWRQSKSF